MEAVVDTFSDDDGLSESWFDKVLTREILSFGYFVVSLTFLDLIVAYHLPEKNNKISLQKVFEILAFEILAFQRMKRCCGESKNLTNTTFTSISEDK